MQSSRWTEDLIRYYVTEKDDLGIPDETVQQVGRPSAMYE